MSATTTVKSFAARWVPAACAAVLVAVAAVTLSSSDAEAFSCRQNVLGTGCIGARGAVAFNRSGAVAVGRYGNVYAHRRGSSCYWRNGQRFCI